jgi:hypothetical protein
MSKEHLSTYLNDHLRGAVAALEIVDRLAAEAGYLGISESLVRRASGWRSGKWSASKA